MQIEYKLYTDIDAPSIRLQFPPQLGGSRPPFPHPSRTIPKLAHLLWRLGADVAAFALLNAVADARSPSRARIVDFPEPLHSDAAPVLLPGLAHAVMFVKNTTLLSQAGVWIKQRLTRRPQVHDRLQTNLRKPIGDCHHDQGHVVPETCRASDAGGIR